MKTVLIVDDDKDLGDLLQMTFGLLMGDVKVERVYSGEDGVIKSKELVPDLIIMDYKMPGINGWEAARLIKENPSTNHIPIVGYTAWAGKDDIKRGHQSGLSEILTKPVDLDVWESKLQRYLR